MIGCLILAAGASRRMGRLKQLLPYSGGTLLNHAIQQVLDTGLSSIVVVTGAESAQVRASIDTASIHFAENPHWESGMGSSIAAGLRKLLTVAAGLSGLGIVLVDQPLITSSHLRAMADELAASGADVVAAQYAGTLGAPAFFGKDTLSSLLHLNPEAGAKKLFSNPAWNIRPFPLPEAAQDIDTPEDFAALSSANPA